jgi:hypothetical protein
VIRTSFSASFPKAAIKYGTVAMQVKAAEVLLVKLKGLQSVRNQLSRDLEQQNLDIGTTEQALSVMPKPDFEAFKKGLNPQPNWVAMSIRERGALEARLHSAFELMHSVYYTTSAAYELQLEERGRLGVKIRINARRIEKVREQFLLLPRENAAFRAIFAEFDRLGK